MIRYYAARCDEKWSDQLVWLDPATGRWFRGPLHAPHDHRDLDTPDLRSRLEREAGGRRYVFAECRYDPGQRHLRVSRGEHVTVESLDPDERAALLGCLVAVRPLVHSAWSSP